MVNLATVVSCVSLTNAIRARREAEATIEYEGTFPNEGFTARRSIFADPRFKQGIEPNLLRRYKHMEKLINFYDQSITNITKYWTYGCWCFQMGDYPLRLGNGSPVDDVDTVCKRQKECYQCAKKDHGHTIANGCIPEETGYRFAASYDQVTNKPIVRCVNKEGTCKRSLCECDKAFAARLPEASQGDNGWTGAHHAHYGGFDARAGCLARIHTPGNGGYELECCGQYPDRYPYRMAKDGSGRQCCNNNPYNSETHACCNDGVVRTNGSC